MFLCRGRFGRSCTATIARLGSLVSTKEGEILEGYLLLYWQFKNGPFEFVDMMAFLAQICPEHKPPCVRVQMFTAYE